MTVFVVDASAAMAFLWQEPGGEIVAQRLAESRCVMCAVNLAEVISKAVERGLPENKAAELCTMLDVEIVPLDSELALETGRLRRTTRAAGLSLGDRACLAVARHLGATALTADRPWLSLDLGIAVDCIRPN